MALKKKGQAAIFDGITFLLLSTFSASLIFVAVSTYGQQEDTVMRSAYTINYMQTVSKAFYHVDAQQLAGVCGEKGWRCEGIDVYKDLAGENGCEALAQYLPGISLSDLLKKDLADPVTPVMDDMYGGIPALGKTAMRCAAKEFMKPFALAGYKYVIEVIRPSAMAGGGAEDAVVKTSLPLITNLPEGHEYVIVGTGADEGYVTRSVCFQALEAGEKVFSVASPFKVTSAEDDEGKLGEKQLVLRVCMWPASSSS